jgi:tetratricopeptide (TPR) repeat protein
MNKPTISACLIVKNEELHIRRCLRSVVKAVDQICIVDTGCTDRTIEIAEKEFGAMTAFRAWDDDFAAARNASIDLATCDWVFQIDADEELYQPDIPRLREFLTRTDADSIYVVMRNFYSVPEAHTGESVKEPMKSPHSANHIGRIFRRAPHLRFVGCIHETIRNIESALVSDISIFHYGYAQGGKVKDARIERNYRLCLKQIEMEPDNPASYYYAGTTCLVGGRHDEAEKFFSKAVEIHKEEEKNRLHFQLMSLYELANLHSRRENYANSQVLCEQALNADPNYLDPWLRVGEAYFFQEKYWAAERALRRYLDLLREYRGQARMAKYSLYMLNSDDYAYFLLGRCAQEREDLEDAERLFKKSIELNPNTWGCYHFLGQVYEATGRKAEAETMFAKAKELKPKT